MQDLPGMARATAERPQRAQTVGVFLCRCADRLWSGLDSGDLERLLRQRASDFVVVVHDDLCRASDWVAELRAPSGLKGAVIPACAEQAGLAHVLRRAGIWPWAIETVNLAEIAEIAGGPDHVVRPLVAAAARVRARLRATPDHLKVAYGPQGKAFDRRALLRSLLEPAYAVVPAVESSQCRSSQGCRLCLETCPAKALRLESGRVTLNKDACTACGACVPTCPSQAISWPGFEVADLDAQLAALLDTQGDSPAPRLLLLTCAGAAPIQWNFLRATGRAPAAGVVLAVPCASSISPALLLRAFERGVQRVAVLCCAEVCAHGHDRTRIRRTASVTTKVLEAIGLAGRQLMLVEGFAAESGNVAEPLAFREASPTAPSEIERPADGRAQMSSQDLGLPAILRRLQATCDRSIPHVITGEDVPFGQIRVDERTLCTLCGVCAQVCPTQALAVTQDSASASLTFSHIRCVACGICVAQCPEQVLHLERALDMSSLDKPPCVLAREDVLRCRRCQQPIATASMLAKVQQALRSLPQKDLGEICPSCRLTRSMSAHGEASVARS